MSRQAEAKREIKRLQEAELTHTATICDLLDEIDSLKQEKAEAVELLLSPEQLEGLAKFILSHGNLDNNAHALTYQLLNQRAENTRTYLSTLDAPSKEAEIHDPLAPIIRNRCECCFEGCDCGCANACPVHSKPVCNGTSIEGGNDEK